MNELHEEKLAHQLECNMAQFLANAHLAVIPAGTLGAGMGFKQSNDTSRLYDKEREVITITGTVKIEVYRAHDSE